jgi:hypothetical protein
MPRGTYLQRVDQDVDNLMPQGEDRGRRANPVNVMLQKKDDGPATVSAAFESMVPRWQRISDLLGGTATMRAAGKTYLPPHPYEDDDNYRERLDRATLKNYTLRTLENLTGKAFKDPPQLNEDVPEPLVKLLDDVDVEGTGWTVFARTWFREALAKAMAYVLVDFTRTEVPEGQKERTLADDDRDGVRPFWRMYCPEDVIFQRKELIGGVWKFTHVRLLEREMVPDGEWGERLVLRIRVLEIGSFTVYELKRVGRSRKQTWQRVDGGPMGIDEIPLVDFYTSKDGLGEGKPPLEDLAFLNVEHWQSSSDQRNILTVTRFPMLAVSGASASDSDKPVIVGPRKWLSVSDPNGRIYYVEHAGAAIQAGSTDLSTLEDQMASYGAEFLRTRPGAASATGRVLDSAEAISPLQAMGLDFKDALERLIALTGKWLKIEETGTVDFDVKPDLSLGDGKDLDIIDSARDRGDISRVAFLAELSRRDILSPQFDPVKDKEELDKEPKPEDQNVSMTLKTGARRNKPSKATTSTNPSDKRGPDSATTTDKPSVVEK